MSLDSIRFHRLATIKFHFLHSYYLHINFISFLFQNFEILRPQKILNLFSYIFQIVWSPKCDLFIWISPKSSVYEGALVTYSFKPTFTNSGDTLMNIIVQFKNLHLYFRRDLLVLDKLTLQPNAEVMEPRDTLKLPLMGLVLKGSTWTDHLFGLDFVHSILNIFHSLPLTCFDKKGCFKL